MFFKIQSGQSAPDAMSRQATRMKRAKFFEGIGWGILALLALLASIFISHKVAAQVPDDAEAGQLLLSSTDGYQPAVHIKTEVDASISGLAAKVSYRQHFRNDSSEWQEAVYVFPLPENAAVNFLELKIADRVITGEIKEKSQAQKIYQQAKREGKKAALLEQRRRNNLFTQKVANIAPGEDVYVEIRYQQLLNYDSGRFEWRLPTTLTPRYIPGSPLSQERQEKNEADGEPQESVSVALSPFGWAMPTDQVPDADQITPFMQKLGKIQNPLTLNLTLDAGLPLANIHGLYHEIDVSKQGNHHQVRFLQNEVPMDRDVVIQWRPVASSAPTAALFKETVTGNDNADIDGDYLLLMMLPPAGNAGSLPRDMVFVIDTSGSMQGPSIGQAKKSLMLALDRLQPDDRFNILQFDSSFTQLYSHLEFVDSEKINRAKQWVGGLRADGGTEMQPALTAALRQFRDDRQRVQQLVFITDGAVGNEQALFGTIHQHLGATRLFTVGIGAAPNSFFMKKAAQTGRGTFTYIGDIAEVEQRMDELFRKLESVVAHDIAVAWPVPVEVYPAQIPDLYSGEPLLLAVKTPAANGDVFIEGVTAEATWRKSFTLNGPAAAESGIATLWAREKVEALEDQKYQGTSAEEVRSQVLPLALAHKLVTNYTSFVAVEQEPVRPQTEKLASSPVPNLVPQGQNVAPAVYPRTASPMILHFFLGGFSSLLLIFLRVWRRG